MGTVGRQIVGDRAEEIVGLLNQGIAAEINDAYRYLSLAKLASGIHSGAVAELFERTAQDEWGHVALLMERLVQLGGRPMASPADAANLSYAPYQDPPKDDTDLRTMLEHSLEGERAAIRFYQNLFERTRDVDPVTAQIARDALADEIDDEDEMERFLAAWPDQG
jgi:ferritin-like protein